jgi:predicted MFS family arabinose efflux permease
MTAPALSSRARAAVLVAAILAMLFDGVELGMMPIASIAVSRALLGTAWTPVAGGDWFARWTAALMLGAAIGGILLGTLGDRTGRARAMGTSVLIYSVFAGLGAFARSPGEMLVLRFLVGIGVGGLWPNALSLANECWSGASRPLVSGAMSAALNAGILLLSTASRIHPVSVDSWRWLFHLAAAPAVLGIAILLLLPESSEWRGATAARQPLAELLGRGLRRRTFSAFAVAAVPMVGAWAASKWMIPWSEAVAGGIDPGYKAATQGWWAAGATLGSFAGSIVAVRLDRRLGYFAMSAATAALTVAMFLLTAPLRASFHPIVFAQGFVATLFFGWLAVFLPAVFPTAVRATGSGLAYNGGRFATAAGVLAAGWLFTQLGGDYPKVGATCALVYALGMVVVWFLPDATDDRRSVPSGGEHSA